MTDDIKKFALAPPPESGKKSRHRSASSMGNIPANINIAELAAQARAQTRVDTGNGSPRAHSVTAAALTSPRAHVVAKTAPKHDRKFSSEAPAAVSFHHDELDVPTIDNFLPGQPPPPPGPPPAYAQRYRNSSVITPSGVEQRFKPRPPPGPPPAHILAQYAPKGAPPPQPAAAVEESTDAQGSPAASSPAPIPEEPSEEMEGKAEQKPKIVQVDALAAMQRGATFLKCGRFGEPHFRRFQLINGNRTLQWTSDKKAASESQVNLADVDVITLGQHTPNFWRLGDRAKALEPGSFSIMHANQSKSLDLVAQDTHQLKIWSEGLAALVREIKFNTENDVSQLKALIVKLDLDNKPVSLQFLSPLPVSATTAPLIPASVAMSMVASAAAKSPASPLSPRSKPPPPPGPPPSSAQRNRGHARTRSAYTGGMESIAVEVAAQVLGPKQLEKDFAGSSQDDNLAGPPTNVDALTPRSAANAETLQKYKLAPPPGHGTPRRTSKDKDTREAGDHSHHNQEHHAQ